MAALGRVRLPVDGLGLHRRGASMPQPGCSRARPRRPIGASATTCARCASKSSPTAWCGRTRTSAVPASRPGSTCPWRSPSEFMAASWRSPCSSSSSTTPSLRSIPKRRLRRMPARSGSRFGSLLGDRPLRMAARVNSQAVAARFARARRALTKRRPTRTRTGSAPRHSGSVRDLTDGGYPLGV